MRPAWIRGWVPVRPGYWFARKRYGWGAVPATWQGWALMLATLLVAGCIAKLTQRSALYQLLFLPLFVGTLWLCWLKTDGGWRWRWGDKD
ncbi:hypothetical protein [Sphingomonas psychrotolerans]|uniref:Uncharacterized protein n=1 Tax=Sphingomonas psychrotolerans TaxID=1327635 RepID=A0A2K8MIQ5_9SPHN|nr:hypothetical protein [Sphingomonas psychrotolerans]ATY33768.1 hypothetical protein CVN68_18880 [Sphingomonas psychrotolerans]